MKPTSQFNNSLGRDGFTVTSATRTRRAPVTDYSFQPTSVDQFHSHCGGERVAPFRSISGDYFKHEARQTFLGESMLFAVIIFTATVPLISSARELLHLVGAL